MLKQVIYIYIYLPFRSWSKWWATCEGSGSSPHKSIVGAKTFITSSFLRNTSEVWASFVCKGNLSVHVFHKI